MRAKEFIVEAVKQRLDPKCWKGKHKEGTKIKGGIRVNNCVPNEGVVEVSDKALKSYQQKVSSDSMKHKADPTKRSPDKANRSIAGFAKAQNRLEKGVAEEEARIETIHGSAYTVDPDKYYVWAWDNAVVLYGEYTDANHAELSLSKIERRATKRLGSAVKGRFEVASGKMLLSQYGGEQGVAEELGEEFDLIENIIENLAKNNGVDAEAIWEDLESLSDDELYVFATTTTITESEAWQKANKKDKTDGMSQKAVNSYRRAHPGSKLKTAVTTKPGKLKKGSKASKRRKSYCSRSRGQMKMHSISCAKTPDKAICKARRRWNC